MKKTSIKFSIQRAIVLNVVLAAGAITVITSYMTHTTALNNNQKQAESLARSYAMSIQDAVVTLKDQIADVAGTDALFASELTPEDRKSYLKVAARKTAFSRLSVSDKAGTTYDGEKVSSKDFFTQAIGGTSYISGQEISPEDGTPVLSIGAEITAVGPTGVVFGMLDGTYFNKYVTAIQLGETGYGFILDKSGALIAHPDTALLGGENLLSQTRESGNAGLESILTDMAGGGSGRQLFTEGGIRKIVTYIPIEGPEGWSLAICQEYGDVMSDFTRSLILSGCVLAGLLLLALLLAAGVAGSLSKPILLLVERLEKLAKGDLASPMPEIHTKNEIRTLSGALESTVSSLKAYISDIDEVLKNISRGNLLVQSGQEYAGDFCSIQESLHTILNSLNQIFREIHRTADRVEKSAGQVAAGSSLIAGNTVTEAGAVEELASMTNQIARSVRQNAQSTRQATELTLKMTESIDGSRQDLDELQTAMDSIRIGNEKIQKIIQVIEDLAFQTNVLSLNASVEAARAGSAGKGFAVVAGEVRSLAQKSAEAAQNTETIIAECNEAVGNGLRCSGKAFDSLKEFTEISGRINSVVREITGASAAQAESIEQIDSGMHQISSAVHSNSAVAEENASVSGEMTGQAHILQEQIQGIHFREK